MAAKNTKLKHGGKRNNSGRKPSNYQTKTIAFRVRLEYVDRLKQLVKTAIAEWSQNNG